MNEKVHLQHRKEIETQQKKQLLVRRIMLCFCSSQFHIEKICNIVKDSWILIDKVSHREDVI